MTKCYICGKRFLKTFAVYKNYRKVRAHFHFTGKYKTAAHSTCNLRFNVSNNMSVVFHIRGELWVSFFYKRINKGGNESVVTISYKTKFTDSARFMATSLSNLADNLTTGVHKVQCKDWDCFFWIWKY